MEIAQSCESARESVCEKTGLGIDAHRENTSIRQYLLWSRGPENHAFNLEGTSAHLVRQSCRPSRSIKGALMRDKSILSAVVMVLLLSSIATGDTGPCPPSQGINIRCTALPDSQTSINILGTFSATQRNGMLSTTPNSHWTLWSQEPPIPNSWTASTYDLRRRMTRALSATGFDIPLANVIINACKVYARDPYHCVVYASAVACAESSCGQSYNPSVNTIFGVRAASKPTYVSRTEAVLDWVRRYNNHWFTANEGKFYGFCRWPSPGTGFLPSCNNAGNEFDTKFFYSNVPGKAPMSNYCLSESGSPAPTCPNGYANSRTAYFNVK